MNDVANRPRKLWWEYIFSALVVSIATGICFAMFPFVELTNLVMVYLLGTLMVATRGFRGSAAFASALGVFCFDLFFVPPRFSFRVHDVQYIFTFIVMFTSAMIISHLTIRLREEAESARKGQRRTEMIRALAERLASSRNFESVLEAAVRTTAETFESHVALLMPGRDKQLEIKASSNEMPKINDKENGIAQWVFNEGKSAGHGTLSLPDTAMTYIPLVGSQGQVGVLRFDFKDSEKSLERDQLILLESFAHQIGLALDVDRLQEKSRKAEVEAETERMRSALLSSVSHDFRTPLTAIVGSASTLLTRDEIQRNHSTLELMETIQSEGERLSRLVQNLLETTRLESGAVHVNKELYPLEEIIGTALERLTKLLKERKITVNIPEDYPLIPLDALLMEQVFINLLENASRHTPDKSPIEISVRSDQASAIISVSSKGPGLNQNDLERIFDKFYHHSSSPGAGLGLAICRAIVKAHGGRIWAENSAHGAIFYFTLPLEISNG